MDSRADVLGATPMTRAVILALALGACTEDPTQMLVVVDSDLEIPGAIDELRFQVAGDETIRALSAPSDLPHSFVVTPAQSPDTQITIEVIAMKAATPVAKTRITTRFVEGKILGVPIFLSAGCAGQDCALLTCTRCGCRAAGVDPSFFERLDSTETSPTLPPAFCKDASDAGVANDGGMGGSPDSG